MTIRTWIISVAMVLVSWISLQLGVMYFTDAAPGAVALFPSDGFISRLPADAAVVDIGNNWIAVRFGGANLGRKLYEAGAWIVLPAGLPGCLPLS
ncbi:hypothetical protein ACS3SW_02255 [Roseobacteraceae bacterium S113]